MFTRSKAKRFGCYKVSVSVEGPDEGHVVCFFDWLIKIVLIRARDLPQDEPEKKPCGCSGS